MKPVSILLYALTADEIKCLPTGFPILRHDAETDAYMLLSAGGVNASPGQISHKKSCTYYALRLPPAGCNFPTSKRRPK